MKFTNISHYILQACAVMLMLLPMSGALAGHYRGSYHNDNGDECVVQCEKKCRRCPRRRCRRCPQRCCPIVECVECPVAKCVECVEYVTKCVTCS